MRILWYVTFITVCILLVAYFVFKTVMRIKHPFWARQPVCHVYDVGWWFSIWSNGQIIRPELPSQSSKYINFTNVQTNVISADEEEGSSEWQNALIECVAANYLRETEAVYEPDSAHIIPYLQHHNGGPCFVSQYGSHKCIGVMTSRPVTVMFMGKSTSQAISAYYVDFLCVAKGYRRKNVAPQIIQTHEYVQRHTVPDTAVSIFKREGELTGIVPLTVYSTKCFRILKNNDDGDWKQFAESHVIREHVLRIDVEKHAKLLHDVLNAQSTTDGKWDIVVHSSLSNLLWLIKTNNIMVYTFGEGQAWYFFRETQVRLRGMPMMCCFASVCSPDCSHSNFITGFYASLAQQHQGECYLSIEDTAHNNIILKNLTNKTNNFELYATSPTAYFFYNYAHTPFNSNRALILV